MEATVSNKQKRLWGMELINESERLYVNEASTAVSIINEISHDMTF